MRLEAVPAALRDLSNYRHHDLTPPAEERAKRVLTPSRSLKRPRYYDVNI
jgi:hypothetical protein